MNIRTRITFNAGIARANAQKRRRDEREEIERLSEKGWEAARIGAKMLKERFGATRVVVFGSLVRGTGFTRWSDVDIAAWGLAPEDTFVAIGAVMDLDTEVPLNLVDVDTARTALLRAIEREGVEL